MIIVILLLMILWCRNKFLFYFNFNWSSIHTSNNLTIIMIFFAIYKLTIFYFTLPSDFQFLLLLRANTSTKNIVLSIIWRFCVLLLYGGFFLIWNVYQFRFIQFFYFFSFTPLPWNVQFDNFEEVIWFVGF